MLPYKIIRLDRQDQRDKVRFESLQGSVTVEYRAFQLTLNAKVIVWHY